MITPETVAQPMQVRAKINAADLTTLITAISTVAVVTLPTGKTLADVTRLQIALLPTADKDGTVAVLNASLN